MASNGKTEIAGETTSAGAGAGVEPEAPEGGVDGGAAMLDAERIEIQTRGMNVEQLLSRIRARTIDLLPEVRRERDGWDDVRQSRLVESLLLKIPLPPVYAVEDAAENWAVVNGMRRLAAVARFVDPDAVGQSPLALAGLEYLGGEFDGAAFKGLPPRMQRRLNETEMVVHVIRHATPEPVKFNIATRINTGGTTLSNQEIRHALVAGPARDFLRELAESSEFRKATAKSVGAEGMADRELVLRFLAFRLTPYRDYEEAGFEAFLGAAMRRLNELDAVAPEPDPEPQPEPEPVEPDAPEISESAGAEDAAVLAGDPLDSPPDGPPDDSPEFRAAFEADVPDIPEQGDAAQAEAPAEPAQPEPAQPVPVTLASLESDFKEAMKTAAAIFGDDAFRKRLAAEEARNPINRALFEAISVTLAGLGKAERKALVAQSDSIKEDFIDLMQNSGFVKAISQGAGTRDMVRKRFGEIEKLLRKYIDARPHPVD